MGWNYFVNVPENIALNLISAIHRRVVCSYNGLAPVPQAIMPSNGTYLLFLNKELRTRLHLKEGDTVQILVERDTSEYGMPISDEMRELLLQDDNFNTHFHALTPGKQRSLIYLVSKVKNSDGRIRKSLAIASHLKDNKGVLDGKLLRDKMKEFSRRK